MAQNNDARETLAEYLSKMKALLNNITPETALAAPEAGLHKARLVWPFATLTQREESKRWLEAHGYGTTPGRPDPTVPKAKPKGVQE